MNRVLTIALTVATFAGVAKGQPQPPPGTAELWIQAPDGSDTINVIISETGIIQLWMDYTAPLDGESRLMVGMDAALEHLIGYGHDFEVVGFNDFGPWGIADTFYRYSRWELDEAPHDGVPDYTGVGNLSYYMFVGYADPPWTESTGLLPNQGAILLDEIIIHGVSDTDCFNRVIFDPGLRSPTWFESFFYQYPEYGYGEWEQAEYDFVLGTGADENNPLYVRIGPPPPVIHVDDDASTSGDGQTWATAYKYLQDALAEAQTNGVLTKIHVAQGTYKPDQDEGGKVTPGDREATFQLITCVALYGGFAGVTEPDPDERDIELYATVLSGDLAQNDVGGPWGPSWDENSYHVVTGSGTDATTVLDGFIITGGNADGDPGEPTGRGGGMYNDAGHPTLTNCTFSGNIAVMGGGGGMYNYNSSPTLTNCTFSNNWGPNIAAGMYNVNSNPTLADCTFSGNVTNEGGGMYNANSHPTLTNCTFSGNDVTAGGGVFNTSSNPTLTDCTFSGNFGLEGVGMDNINSSPTLTNCTFEGNSSSGAGGGMHNYNSNPTLTNCTFSGNDAAEGGGMCNWSNSSPTLTNCTFGGNFAFFGGAIYGGSPTLVNCMFTGNWADWGGGIYGGSPTLTNCTLSGNSAWTLPDGEGGGIYGGSPTLANCILWDNSDSGGVDESAQIHGGTPVVNYCCIQGWTGSLGGVGNIGDDPLFVDADGPDDIPGTEDDNFRLCQSSPCVDAGDNTAVPVGITTDLDGNPRFHDDPNTPDTGSGTPPIVDMGAYESQMTFLDCNCNAVNDSDDIASGTSHDCNTNGIPDECDTDCNANGFADECDIAKGTSDDCNTNNVPDECDIATGTSGDCNSNDVPDECDIMYGTSADENGDGVPDECVIYVDDDAPLGGDGTSWATAFKYLQDALAVATPGDEIRVAAGTYKPDQDEAGNVTPGDREATFQLINGVAIYGGYAGVAGGDPNERNIALYESILSGDLAGDDGSGGDNSENSHHVTTGNGTDETAVLDGFIITGGNATSGGVWWGAGMVNHGGSPTLTNCTFSGNSAGRGGGMSNLASNPTLANCTFSGNHASHVGGGMDSEESSPTLTNCTFNGNLADDSGGGICHIGGNLTLTNCTFTGNAASDHGGGMYNDLGNLTLTNCTFTGNSGGPGAGMYVRDSTLTLANCTFSGNSANGDGGGMNNGNNSSLTLTNCTFSGNSASRGGGMSNWQSSLTLTNCTFADNSALNGRALACVFIPSNLQMANSILWDGGDEIWNDDGSTITVAYSDVQGGWPGEGNIDADPMFVGGPMGCYYLSQTAAGQPQQSPCVDAGSDTAADLGLDTLTTRTDEVGDAGVVDMGYHYSESDGTSQDCNSNGIADECDIAQGTSADCQPNGIPDECEPDCNTNSVPDECDIAEGTSADCQPNGIPDECDFAGGTSQDCNTNGIPDECDIGQGTSQDINTNGVPDECETADLSCAESDQVIVPGGTVWFDVFVEGVTGLNAYQIDVEVVGTSGTGELLFNECLVDEARPDFVFFGIDTFVDTNCSPDDLRITVVAAGSETVDVPHGSLAYLGRYVFDVSADATNATTFELRIKPEPDSLLLDEQSTEHLLAPGDPCQTVVCEAPTVVAEGGRYLQVTPNQPGSLGEQAIRLTSPSCPAWSKYVDADGCLVDTPAFLTAVEWDTVHITGDQIVPSFDYEVGVACGDVDTLSASVPATTWLCGDVNNDTVVNVIDIQKVVQCAEETFYPPTTVFNADLDVECPTLPTDVCDLDDLMVAQNAFRALPCPGSAPCGGRSTESERAPTEGDAVITLVAADPTLGPGNVFVVDAFIYSVADLRGYQLELSFGGGSSGSLECEDLMVDTGRPDYVFCDAEVADWPWANLPLCRLSSSLTESGMDVDLDSKYLGTFLLRSTPDAEGSFSAELAATGSASFLRNSVRGPIGFEAGSLVLTVVAIPGDIDLDADVDLNDFAGFALCLGGSGVTDPPVGCSESHFGSSDTDADGDVDLNDFAIFTLNFGD